MLPTESLGWNCFQALKSRLIVRLAKFSRNRTVDNRPLKVQNDAAFFEADLRYIFTTDPILDLSEDEYHFTYIEKMLRDLLASLDDMVKQDLIEPLNDLQTDSHDMQMLGDKFPRLRMLAEYLETCNDEFNLITGPGLSMFDLPQGQAREMVIDGVTKWKAFLERLVTAAPQDQKTQVFDPPWMDRSKKKSELDLSDVQSKPASVLIKAIFKEIKQLHCRDTHEIRLKVSEEWQTGPGNPSLDMLVSCCHDADHWQQTKCGSFRAVIDDVEEDSICAAIKRARGSNRTMFLSVDQQRVVDISKNIPAKKLALEELSSPETLDALLLKKAFNPITPQDYLKKAAVEKVGTREKVTLALSLARCLMDFFGEDVGLAWYSLKPETIFCLRPVGAHASRMLYISLRSSFSEQRPADLLKTVGPGNPVLLSFARLLLEIDNGEKIPMEISAETEANISAWAEMCYCLQKAEMEGIGNFLQAVKGCLYLHIALPRSQDPATGSAASDILRKVIYEQIVQSLELVLNPQSIKRKRGDSISDFPLAKKPSISTVPIIGSQKERPLRDISAPKKRDDFEVAIICALVHEYEAMYLLIDEFWDKDCDYYGAADGDPHEYRTGRIGQLNVVLALLPNMGKVAAASASASLRSSYPGLRLILVTGICGGVPYPDQEGELLLGDVVISNHIIQYDLGRQYPGEFIMRDTPEDNLSRASKSIRSFLNMSKTIHERDQLERKTGMYLKDIQNSPTLARRGPRYHYPGASQDKLFHPDYEHKHDGSSRCLCVNNCGGLVTICKEYRQLSCKELGCNEEHLVRRERLEEKRKMEHEGHTEDAQAPSIFFGRVASGDRVMKSGRDRDDIAKRHGVIAFEMEGAGVWDEVPCIVVKAVCDYADSHKNKLWQNFAAATAASATKALLERYQRYAKSRNRSFVS